MASTDAKPVPIKNQAYRVTFPIFDADGALQTGAAALDSEVSKDAAAFADCTNEATEIGSSGFYYLDLTSTEMNADCVVLKVTTTTTGARVPSIVFYPEEAGDIRADAVMISGDSTAADTLELQFDGTGISGDTYPATQAQAGSISVGSAAINTVPASYTLTTGTQTVGTFASTAALDGTRHTHTDTAGAMELYYQFSVGSDGIPVRAKVTGALTGNNDTLGVFAYNWAGTAWNQIGSFVGTVGTTNTTHDFDLLTSHVGTGSNVGLVRVRFYAASGLSTATLYVDQILVSYAQASQGIANGSTVTLGAATTNTNLVGQNWTLVLNGQDISGSYIKGAKSVTGVSSGTTDVTFEDCDFGAATVPPGKYINCGFGLASGTLTAASAGQYLLRSCYSRVPGSGTPAFDWATSAGTVGVNGRQWHGGSSHTIDSDVTVSWEVGGGGGQTFDGGGSVELRGTMRAATLTNCAVGKTSQIVGVCGPIGVNGAGGTVNIYGMHGVVTDSSGAAVTINDLGATTSTLADTGDAMTLADDAITASKFDETTAFPVKQEDDGATELARTGIIGTPMTLNTLSADIATVDGNVDTILGQTGTTGVVLTTGVAGDVADAVWDEASSGHTTAGTFGQRLYGIRSGTAQAGGATTITLDAAASATNDFYNGSIIVLTAGTGAGQPRPIIGYNGTTKVATVTTWATNPANDSVFVIIPITDVSASLANPTEIAQAVWEYTT